MSRVGQRLSVVATGIGLDGQALARHGDEPVEIRVSDLFPGEAARVVVEAESRHHDRLFARVQRRTQSSPQRRPASCEAHVSRVAGGCDGCVLMELGLAGQHEAKLDMVERIIGRRPRSMSSGVAEWGYRYSAKRMVGGRAGSLILGSRVRKRNELADMAGCRVDHPELEACFAQLVEIGNELGIEPHDPVTGRGDLRHVWAKTDGERALVVLVTAREPWPVASVLADRWTRPAGVWWSVRADDGNAMRGDTARRLRGISELDWTEGDMRVRVAAQGFLQPNPGVASQAYRALVHDGDGGRLTGERCLDLYAGAGVTTALLRRSFARVHACDAHAESAGPDGIVHQSSEQALQAALDAGEAIDAVIANPPRSGLGTTVCDSLVRLDCRRLHIMSCHPSSLARDLARLCAGPEPRFELESLEAFDTLPQTPHVELVARLIRPSIAVS